MGKESQRGKSTLTAPPRIVILAGPNGAGKSSAAASLLRGALKIDQFVNADAVAKGLSEFDPESVAIDAGRIMLKRLRELAAARETFAFETTLASKSFAPWIRKLQETGYEFHLVFLWLPNAEVALARVQDRVLHGGHQVPPEVIRRRYVAGLRNFFEIYRPLADAWRIVNNSVSPTRAIARGRGAKVTHVADRELWRTIEGRAKE